VDWSDKESVKKLNSWRAGLFCRQIGPKQTPRAVWLEEERDTLLDVNEQVLARRDVRGRWSMIDWNSVTARYNALVVGTIQKFGALTAERTYAVNSNHELATSTPQAIKKARKGPPRDKTGIKNQLQHFSDERSKKLVAGAKKADEDAAGSISELSNGPEEENDPAGSLSGSEVDPVEEDPAPKRQKQDTESISKGKGKEAATQYVTDWDETDSDIQPAPKRRKLVAKDKGKAKEEASAEVSDWDDFSGEESEDSEMLKAAEESRKQYHKDRSGDGGGSSSRSAPASGNVKRRHLG
jgi:hypothetical protein